MGTLGVSLYPEKTTFAEDKDYLKLARKYGFQRIFMNLLLFREKGANQIVERLRQSIAYGNELGFATSIDINPYTLKILGLATEDLAYFADLGVKGLRLDMGFTGKEESAMTKNKLGLKIEINMSNEDHYLERILDYSPNKEHLVGCHNFFPQAYTGLDTDYFCHCSKRFTSQGLKTAAFVTSQVGKIGPWPLHEGLCTLENHRHLPIASQVKHLKALEAVDDLIIGNAYASENELAQMSAAFYSDELSLTVELNTDITAIEREIIEKSKHSYRGDRSVYMIRSSGPRFFYRDQAIPPHLNDKPIQSGDLLILNDDYGQYKGEVQIALKDRPQDERVNIVGRISEADRLMLAVLRPYSDFTLSSQN